MTITAELQDTRTAPGVRKVYIDVQTETRVAIAESSDVLDGIVVFVCAEGY
jgi:hypothetical protein